MSLSYCILPHTLLFHQPSGTSRGIYTERKVWYIVLQQKNTEVSTDNLMQQKGIGVGECAPLPNLSVDYSADYERQLRMVCEQLLIEKSITMDDLRSFPSALFGLETAFRHFERQTPALWDTPFSRKEEGILINGLIWMGNYHNMLQQIEKKIMSGYRCIKMKIGAIDFEEEYRLLSYIRRHYHSKEIEIRVDANGAFSPQNALPVLEHLAAIDIHSIEQPITAGRWDEMARIIERSPLPVALDEELIGVYDYASKCRLLDMLRPDYIILKPSLHGGFTGGDEWIKEADKRGIGWWVTSALESNVGLNAIAQWCATLNNSIPQGLGTGSLFTNNISLPLSILEDRLWYGK